MFYARVRDPAIFDLIEFYAEDIRSLERMGFEVVRTNSVWQALRSDGDLLFAWWWHTALPVMVGWRLRGRPVVATGTSQLFERLASKRLEWAARTCLIAAAVHLATVNLAVSRIEARKLRRIHAPRVQLLPHAIDTDFFRPGPKSAIPSAVVIAQMNAPSMKRKGVDVAVRIAELVRRDVPNFQLLLVGPLAADGTAYLEDLEGEVGLAGVQIMGQVSREEKRLLLSEAWVYLQPSAYEGFGVAVLEAMACGAVPVCSAAGALPEVVGEAGVVVEPVSAGAFAAEVLALVEGSERREHLAIQARRRSLDFDSIPHARELSAILCRAGVAHPGIA